MPPPASRPLTRGVSRQLEAEAATRDGADSSDLTEPEDEETQGASTSVRRKLPV